jgi:hypothetical protein
MIKMTMHLEAVLVNRNIMGGMRIDKKSKKHDSI